MMGKEVAFSIVAEYQGKEQDIFNIYEGISMERFRIVLNESALLLGALFLLLILFVFLFLRFDLKQEIRSAYQLSFGAFSIFWITAGILLSVRGLQRMVGRLINVDELGVDSLLLKIATPEFVSHGLIAIMLLSLVFMGIIGYVIYKLTKPKRIFW
jgi:hypothetical protein